MTEIKTFRIQQKFVGVDDLYKYLLKNVGLLEEVTDLKIQKPLKDRPFCITAKASKDLKASIRFFTSSIVQGSCMLVYCTASASAQMFNNPSA